MKMDLFDTHAHLNDPILKKLGQNLFEEAKNSGIRQMMAIGIDLKSSYECCEIAEKNNGVYASVGVHPNSSHLANLHHWDEILELTNRPKVVALGETGMDCYWDDCPLAIQKEWFIRHIDLSHQSGLPLVVHQRESEKEILEIFAEHHQDGSIHGIMHSFTGSWETAKTCLDYGMYISFAGMITFKNAESIREVAKQIPLNRVLVETDSPYLTPHPFRGKRPNQPSMVRHTASYMAEMLGLPFEEFASITTDNAIRVFNIQVTDQVEKQ